MTPADPSPPAHRTGSPGAAWLLALALFAVGLGVYSNALSGPFVFDDESGVVRNANLRSLTPLVRALDAPPNTGANGRPLVALSLALNHALGGLEVEGYRAFNIALHALCAVLLFALLERALALATPRLPARPTAFATALLWVVHPLCTDAVNLVITRNEELMALFYLLTLYAALRGFSRPGTKGARAWLSVAVLACALGMASKENMVSAPIAVLLFDRSFVSGTFARALRGRPLFYAGLAATWALLAALTVTAARGETVGLDRGMGVLEYFFVQAEVVPHYLRLAFWPAPLVMDYGDWFTVQDQRGWLPWAAPLSAAGAGVLLLVWRRSALGFAAFVFAAVLAPTSSFVPITGEVAAEHRMYLPLATVLTAVVGLASQALGRIPSSGLRRGLAAAGVLALAASFASGTYARNATYRTADGIWRDTIDKRPLNARSYCGLATELLRQNRLGEAIDQLERCVRMRPRFGEAHRLLGAIYARSGREAESREHYEAAARYDPDLARFVLDAAENALRAGDESFAKECVDDVLRMRPAWPPARRLSAWIQAAARDRSLRDRQGALVVAQELCTNDASAENLDLLGAALARIGHFDEAVLAAEKSVASTRDARLAAARTARLELYRSRQSFEGAP